MRALTLFMLCIAFPVFAQDRAGNDTAGPWRPTHHKIFDLWDSVCDQRDAINRCYIRYVDVFSPAPNFGAVFVFITPEATGHKIEFGYERGQRFAENGFYISKAGERVWHLNDPCLRTQKCLFKGPKAAELLSVINQGDTLHQDFIDRHGQQQALEWDLSDFTAVLTDFEKETAARELR